jgi:hypothetical protein
VNDRQRIRLAEAIRTRTALLAQVLNTVVDGTTVMGRMRDMQGGLRAKSFDGPGGSMRHDATFAGTVALDQAVLDERDLDKALKAASVEVTKAWEILARYPPAHRATDSDLLALGRANRRQDPGCESCARTTSPAGGKRWEPPRAGQAQPTFVGGRLDEPMLLCEWCYQCVRRWGRLPSGGELERHHRGDIVSWPHDVPRPQ